MFDAALPGPSPSEVVHLLEWLAAAAAIVAVGAWYARRSGRRALLRFRARVDRFKLASRKSVRERLLADSAIAAPFARTPRRERVDRGRGVEAGRGYVHEIVPFFNVVAYYQIGYRAAERLLDLFYKVAVEHEDRGARSAAARCGPRLPHQSPVERRLRARELRARRSGRDLVRGGRVGACVSARAHLQGVRLVLRATAISRAALPRGARALRAAHHARGRDAGNLPRGRTHSRRTPQAAQDRAARLRPRDRARSRHIARACASCRSPSTTIGCSRTGRCCASWRRREGASASVATRAVRRGSHDTLVERGPPGRAAMEAIRTRGGRRSARRFRSTPGSRATPTCSSCPKPERLRARPGAVRSGHVANRRVGSGHAGSARLRGDPELRP